MPVTRNPHEIARDQPCAPLIDRIEAELPDPREAVARAAQDQCSIRLDGCDRESLTAEAFQGFRTDSGPARTGIQCALKVRRRDTENEMWLRSVRATHLEKMRRLPGDELIPEPIGTLTHAITIRRPASEIWPWLAQMGAGSRAGWYSYDLIDNGRRQSALRIVPELQHIAVGTLFPALPGAADGFHVLQIEVGAISCSAGRRHRARRPR